MSWLLALHSSSEDLGVGVQSLAPDGERRCRRFPLGRALANRLFDCVEDLLPAGEWPRLRRLVVATGPGGFTGTRLTVVMARTLAQQLAIPLHGISSFALVAARQRIDAPTWVVQELARRGQVAGLYAPESAAPESEAPENGAPESAALAGVAELEAPRLFAPGEELPAGPRLAAAVELPADIALLLDAGQRAELRQLAGPWQPVLPHYPTSPVAGP